MRYFSSAANGQVEVCVAPMVMVQLWRKGSVFEALIRSWTEMRLIVVSVCRSVVWGSNELVDGEQSSLARRKP